MKLTKRGKRVQALALIILGILLLWGIWELDTHLWFNGSAYCWGSMAKCYGGGL